MTGIILTLKCSKTDFKKLHAYLVRELGDEVQFPGPFRVATPVTEHYKVIGALQHYPKLSVIESKDFDFEA